MPPDVEEIDTEIALQIRLIRKQAEVRRTNDTNLREARGRFKRAYEKILFSNQNLPQMTMSLSNIRHLRQLRPIE